MIINKRLEELKIILIERLKDTEWSNPEYFDYLWMNGLRIKTFHLLEPKSELKILDIGCGDGWFSIQNALIFRDIYFIGIDLYEAEEAKKNAQLFKLKNCIFMMMDAYKMDFKEEFDAAILFFSLGNICSRKEDLINLFSKIKRALRVRGKILIAEPFQENFKEYNKLKKLYEISKLHGKGEEKETILSQRDVLNVLKKLNFEILKIIKHNFTWRTSIEEFLKYFKLKELPFKIKEFYYRDKPKQVTIIIAQKQ